MTMSQVDDETEPVLTDFLPPFGSANRVNRGRQKGTRGGHGAAQSRSNNRHQTKNANSVLLPHTQGSGFGKAEVDHFLGMSDHHYPI